MLKKLFAKKKLQISETETIETAQTWSVEWSIEQEICFSEADAIKLKDAIKAAYKLLKLSEQSVHIINNQTKAGHIY